MKEGISLLSVDKYELGIIINALNEMRNKQIQEERPTEPVDELLLKMVDIYENGNKKKSFLKDDEAR